MTRLLGALLWSLFLLLAFLFVLREEGRRLSLERGLCRLASHLSEALCRAPLPLSRIFADFEDDALARTDFLSRLRSEGLAVALKELSPPLSEDTLRPYKEYAALLGQRLYEEEKRAAEGLCREAESAFKKKEEDAPRRRRLFATLFFSGGMLLLLLLL